MNAYKFAGLSNQDLLNMVMEYKHEFDDTFLAELVYAHAYLKAEVSYTRRMIKADYDNMTTLETTVQCTGLTLAMGTYVGKGSVHTHGGTMPCRFAYALLKGLSLGGMELFDDVMEFDATLKTLSMTLFLESDAVFEKLRGLSAKLPAEVFNPLSSALSFEYPRTRLLEVDGVRMVETQLPRLIAGVLVPCLVTLNDYHKEAPIDDFFASPLLDYHLAGKQTFHPSWTQRTLKKDDALEDDDETSNKE